MMNKQTSGMSLVTPMLFEPQASVVRHPLVILILLLLPQISCARYQARRELTRNQFFAEIIRRESIHWMGTDKFFESSLLTNPDPEVRRWSALALGRVGCPRALPLLYRALHRGDAAVRAVSAFAIGEIEDRVSLEQQCLDLDPDATVELCRLLDDPSLTVQMRAIEALGKIGSYTEAANIVRRLEDFHYRGFPAEREFLNCAITALTRLKNPAAAPVLKHLAASSDPEVRWRALDSLARLQVEDADSLFITNLGSLNPAVQAYAARGLGLSKDPDAAARLVPLLSPRQGQTGIATPPSVRFCALQSLGELRSSAVVPFIRAALLADPIDAAHPAQFNFAIQAAATLGNIGGIQGEAILVPLLKLPEPVAGNSVIALAQILKGNPERFFQLVDRKQFASQAYMPAWAQAMGVLGGSDAAKELNRMLMQTMGSDNPSKAETLAAILTALAKIKAPGWQDILATFFDSQNPRLLLTAVELYQPETGAKEPWIPVIKAFTASAASGDAEAATQILWHLKPWVREPIVQKILRSSLENSELDVRLVCAALLRKAAATDIAENPGPANGSNTDSFCYALAATRKNSTIARLETDRGVMEIELFREDAPVTVANFVLVAKQGAYDGLEFDRVVPLNRIEGGISQRQTGLRSTINREINMRPFERGSVGMALAGTNSDTSRFFITLAPQPYLDGIHTCFGRVVSGMQVANRMVPGDHIRRIVIKETVSTLDYYRY